MSINRDDAARLALPVKNPCRRAARGLVAMLQGLFQDGEPGFRWSTDRDKTDIWIAEGSLKDVKTIQKLPAVLVAYSGATWVLPCQPERIVRDGSHTTTTNQASFTLSMMCVGEDIDIVDSLGWIGFGIIPRFMDLLDQNTGISIFGQPTMQPTEVSGKDNRVYPAVMVQMNAAVFVSITRDWVPRDGVFDNAVRRATMVLESDAPGDREPQVVTGNRLDKRHHPQSMTDLVLGRGPNGETIVSAPSYQPPTEPLVEDIDLSGRDER